MSRNRNSKGPSLPAYYSQGSGNSSGGQRTGNSNRDALSLARSKPRAGPNRTTKASGKLKILPEEPEDGVTEGGAVLPPQPILSTQTQRQQRHAIMDSGHPMVEADDDEESTDDEEEDGEEQRTKISKQLELARIPAGSMRRDARRITRKGRASLPRVTAYSTATSYRMSELSRWLQARRETHRTNAMAFDECIYSTYSYDLVEQSRTAGHSDFMTPADHHKTSTSPSKPRTGDLLGIDDSNNAMNGTNARENDQDGHASSSQNGASTATLVDTNDEDDAPGGSPTEEDKIKAIEKERQRREEARQRRRERFAVPGMIPEVFFMEYGTVVIWGMTLAEEKKLLREIRRFEVEKLASEDIESEDLNWYLADYSRIYNDVITLRKGSSYMTKLSLSHALAQSTKISFFEGIIDNTIDSTKDIPQSIAESGKIGMPPVDIMKQIGHLFILRMNIHLVGSIVDSPEIFWAQPDLEPLYSAARSYLEIPQRIELLNARVEVLQDMLQLLKDQVTSSHSEWLEIIVIVLILLEIVLGVATMIVDLYFA